jgi:PKD repeat protein
LRAQNYSFNNSWGKQGFNLTISRTDLVQLVFSIKQFSIDPITIKGQNLKRISLPGVFLPNDAGEPDLPGIGHYVSIPQGSTPRLKIVDSEVEIIQGVNLSPAPKLPLDTQKDIVYPKDTVVYSTNAFFPFSPIKISTVEKFRGNDVVMVGITPFQYNPVTKELKVFKNIKIELSFEGGKGTFGNDAFRSPYWDPIMADNILNYSSLPNINYPARMQQIRDAKSNSTDSTAGCEYIIICPNGPDFIRWADSLKNFRNQQGILTKVFTLQDIGGNTESAIKNFIDSAYNNWAIKPAACLLLGDYGTDANKNIISHLYVHPAGYPNFASDNYYADVDGDEMPDVVFARIAANDSTQLRTMVGRILNFERNRPIDTGYYMHPISALGWEDDRWFQLCSEIVGGFWKNVLHKNVQRINALYTPANNYNSGPWSTANNTSTIMSYFGPSGLNYIPLIPGTIGGFTGGNATQINTAINNGAFILLHRDHGNYTGWGEPAYSTTNINQLTNTLLPFVFSINCETGAFHNPSGCPSACFQEVFQRLTHNGNNAGALGLVCPTEVSYSFVNDTYLWGLMDNLWPNFMPNYESNPVSRGILPAFGNAAGKYFLKQSSWPYNTGDKLVTYRLFHAHCDAFLQLADTVPLNLTVVHDSIVSYGLTTLNVEANDNALISLTVANEIIATAYGSASGPVAITIPLLPVGTQIMIVVTKQNYNRYSDFIRVTDNVLAEFSANNTNICVGSSVNFSDLSFGTPTSWNWTFQGGNPGTSTDKDPIDINYATPGTYDVSLTVAKPGQNPNTMTKTGFINVYEQPVANFSTASACVGSPTLFTYISTHSGSTILAWSWNFGDPLSGVDNTSVLQNPTHTFSTKGTYNVTLNIQSTGGCTSTKMTNVVIDVLPSQAGIPSGNTNICQGGTGIVYTTSLLPEATFYNWIVSPDSAGVIIGTTNSVTLNLDSIYFGPITVKVQASNGCGAGAVSDELQINMKTTPVSASKPNGPDSVNTNRILSSDFTTNAVQDASGYDWLIDNPAAGTIAGDLTGTAVWTNKFSGVVKISVKSKNECGDAIASDEKRVVLYAPTGISEINDLGFEVYPNPTMGKFTIEFNPCSPISINIDILNVFGTSLFAEKALLINGKFDKIIDFSRMPNGVYFIKIETGFGSLIRKVVIQK